MKSNLFVGTLLMGLSLACSFNVKADQVNNDLGRGVLSYDLDAGLKDRCIELLNQENFSEDVRRTTFSLQLVKTKDELIDKMKSSSSGGGSYLSFNGKAKASFMKEKKWTNTSVYILVKTQRVTNKIKISRNKLLLTNDQRNLALDSKYQFAQSCGDKFITEIEKGGEIYGLLEIVTKTYEEKSKLEMSASASGSFGVGKGSGSTEYSRTIKKFKERFAVNVEVFHLGGSELKIPHTEQGLLEAATNIEKISDEHPVSLGFITRDYTTLSNFFLDPNAPEVIERQGLIDTAVEKIKEARTLYANGLYVLANPGDFKMLGFDKEQLQKELNQLELHISKLENLKETAYSFQNEVDEELLVNMPEVKLPKKKLLERNDPLKVSCVSKESSICGVKTYKKQESANCGVLSFKTGTGPVCGEIYNVKSGPACGVKTYKLAKTKACGFEKIKIAGSFKVTVKVPKQCRHESHGVEEYNTCEDESFGLDKYKTCASPEFGYNFNSCEHFRHGPEQFEMCEVAKIGNKETYCPNL